MYPEEEYQSTVPAVTLDTYEGPGDADEPADPRDEYDRDAGLSGYDERHWIF